MRILGIDLSLNHAGFVALCEEGGMSWFQFVAQTKKEAKKGGSRGVYLDIPKREDRQQFQMDRLVWWEKYLREVFDHVDPDYIGIEDYAYNAKGTSYQIGELGGLARILAVREDTHLRLHDPQSIKMFLAHDGSASPEKVSEAVVGRWATAGAYFSPLPKQACEDLCVAYGIAQLVLAEVNLRAGSLLMSNLHPKEVQVFNRVTKTYPVSLLGREWIVGKDPEAT